MEPIELTAAIVTIISFGILMFFAGSFFQWKKERDRVDRLLEGILKSKNQSSGIELE